MATFRVVPDKRYSRKDGTHRYCLVATVDGAVNYLPLKLKLSATQHKMVFEKKSMVKEYIDYREKINELETKAERIYSSMRTFDYIRFKQLFYRNGDEILEKDDDLPKTLAVKGLFEYFIKNRPAKCGTIIHKKSTLGVLERYHPNLYVEDVNVRFLMKFEKDMLDKGKSYSTVTSYLRDLRTVINYFRQVKKIIPNDVEYAFGHGGYSIKAYRRKKEVLTNEEILSVMEFSDFDSPKQEYARNIWMVLYYGSGINPVDLLKLRWSDVNNRHIHLIRTKTETTRQSVIQELTLPLTEDFKYFLNKVAVPESISPFVLGKLHEGYTDMSLLNRKNRFRQEVNPELKKISKKLNLSAPLLMATARDCYASTLKRNGESRDTIGEMLGHRDPRTTAHYLDSLSIEETFRVNGGLVSRRQQNKEEVMVTGGFSA
jgi:integrase